MAPAPGSCVAHGCVRVSCDADFVSIDTSAGSVFQARACVLACGARYALHRQLGLPPPAFLLHTAQAELPAARLGDVEVHFGAETAPEGFAWAAPVLRDDRPYARVGVMCAQRAPRYFKRMVDRISRALGHQRRGHACTAAEDPAALGHCPHLRTPAARGGDAAGLVKSTTGGGIYYSLLSATLAADMLADALA